ncbi:MAG: tripartite tricarboxylate transporter TctB family protein, partial [Mailhella sp.]|nr:tripartite tricarboxylate transporter TctB family protein [Mailhella sp.]
SLGGIDYSSFPKLYAVILIVLCSVNILLLMKKGVSTQGGDASPEKRRRILILTLLTGAITVIYTLLLPYVNFIAVTSVFLFVMFCLYGRKNMLLNGGVAVGGSVLFWFVFIFLSHLSI